ncbi:MAG: hypothetical protein HY231_03545 [Acidobacteria bacterium]|nr:hypothetical protein [Acidobacteriota bacterium]
MTLGLTLSVVGLTAIALFMWKKNQEITGQLLDTRVYLKTLGVQIICGNCSGEGETPIRTYLDAHGNCSQCGGASYVLASTLGVYALLAREAQLYGNQARLYEIETGVQANMGRVISLEEHLANRGERVEKLAS